jgi:hypothetical protein
MVVVLVVLVSVGTLGVASTLAGASTPDRSAPKLADPSATGRKLVTDWLTALQNHDAKAIAAFLAPNFQIQRADGTSSNREQYLQKPAQVTSFEFGSTIVGLQHGSTLSVRWSVKVNETIDGKVYLRGEAARLTGFVWSGKRWQIVTYANFNVPQ